MSKKTEKKIKKANKVNKTKKMSISTKIIAASAVMSAVACILMGVLLCSNVKKDFISMTSRQTFLTQMFCTKFRILKHLHLCCQGKKLTY